MSAKDGRKVKTRGYTRKLRREYRKGSVVNGKRVFPYVKITVGSRSLHNSDDWV